MFSTLVKCIVLSVVTAKLTSWDTTCGSKFDRINTEKLDVTVKTPGGKFDAGDVATIETSGSCNLHGPFMGGSWSVRVYDGVHAHPIGDFTGDLAQVLSFPDAKNTTFKIEDNTIGIISYGVNFPFPKKTGTSNDFQISFSAQDFSHATYFCVNIYYNLDTGEFKMADQENKPVLHQDPPDIAQSKGSGVCGDPCLNSKTCKKELNCDSTQNHCISGMSNTTTGDDCNAAKNSTVGFAPCSCNVVHAAECAGAVATCAVACVGSFGAACLACIGTIAGCCDCASDLFHFDCSHC